MAQRPIWRGNLRLALVSCPIALYSAKQERGTIHFHLINPRTGNRIQMITQDAETAKPVSRRDLVKGYEYKKDNYVLLKDTDFESVKVSSSSTINIQKFVDASSIDPLYYDTSYFVAPDGAAGQDVYAVLYEAIKKAGRIALSRVVIAQRERTIALRAMEGGLIAHTLYEQRDIHDAKAVFDNVTAIRIDPEMVTLATQLINRQTAAYDPSDMEDRYETRLRALIDAKLQGKGITDEEAKEPDPGNVVDLIAALKKSLGQASGPPPKAANAPKTKAKAKRAAGPAPAAPPLKPARKRA